MFGYGLGYTNLMYYNIMPWNVVKTNINTKKPIYVSAKAGKNDEEGHAITIYGYSNVAGKNYVLFWNSGNGSVTSMEYKTTGGVFTYANETFVWRSSISAV